MPRKRVSVRESAARKSSRKSGRIRDGDDEVPEVYKDLLQEAADSGSHESRYFERPTKRRKTEKWPEASESRELLVKSATTSLFNAPSVYEQPGDAPKLRQIVYDDLRDSDESDADFEDVELEPVLDNGSAEEEHSEQQPLRLDLSAATRTDANRHVQRRKPVSKAERDLRLHVHKWHILCLLLHLQWRNHWCESEEVQSLLKPLVPRKTIVLLHVDESKPQFQRSHSFMKGIEEICAFWRAEWTITARGIRRSVWKEDVDLSKELDEAEDPIDFEDFKHAAKSKSGSRDLGAQMFCALLRSVAVEARLVCSLQTLPFSATAKGHTPQKPKHDYVYAPAQTFHATSSAANAAASPSNPRWRTSEYATTSSPTRSHPSLATPPRKIRDSPFPVFWVEVFSPATTAWIPVDALVRHTINKPKTGFEPPASDILNSMSYVIAFEEDGSAKDVTRRYTQYYNGKTRKARIESTKNGEKWWKRTMKFFSKERLNLVPEVRDVVEDADLARREASEGMPKNVQDFKGHPIYVLERHLRANEVVFPRREVGKVGTGVSKGKDPKLESVFRRKDVHVVRSADQWYRKGRDIKAGEAGLKRGKQKSKGMPVEDESEQDDEDGAALYAEFQTDIYTPPPVVQGMIPRNAYGNLDVYVPSMIPPGAIHVQHPEATKGAKTLGIDFADAVTGFDFKGRQGTAVVNGIVVAAEYREAIVEVIQAIEHERVQAEEARRSTMMLQLWRRFLTALRIKRKVDEDYGDDELESHSIGDDEDDEDKTYKEDSAEDEGGGFMPEVMEEGDIATRSDGPMPAMPPLADSLVPHSEPIEYHEIVVVASPHQLASEKVQPEVDAVQSSQELEAGSCMAEEGMEDDNDYAEEFLPEHDDQDGGFVANDKAESVVGGGFLIDSEDEEPTTQVRQPQNGSRARLPDVSHSPPQPRVRADASTTDNLPDTDILIRDKNVLPLRASSVPPAPPLLRKESTEDSILNGNDGASLMSHDPEDEDAEPDWLMESD